MIQDKPLKSLVRIYEGCIIDEKTGRFIKRVQDVYIRVKESEILDKAPMSIRVEEGLGYKFSKSCILILGLTGARLLKDTLEERLLQWIKTHDNIERVVIENAEKQCGPSLMGIAIALRMCRKIEVFKLISKKAIDIEMRKIWMVIIREMISKNKELRIVDLSLSQLFDKNANSYFLENTLAQCKRNNTLSLLLMKDTCSNDEPVCRSLQRRARLYDTNMYCEKHKGMYECVIGSNMDREAEPK